jgi:hypothetical protein
MLVKRISVNILGVLLVLLLFTAAKAQMQTLGEFEGVKISVNLKHEDTVVEKGKYDLEFVKHGQNAFYIKFKQKNKTVCLIPGGERVMYENQGNEALLNEDPDIPVNARFKMKKNPAVKIAYIIFETGKHTMICRFYKIRFKIKYEE